MAIFNSLGSNYDWTFVWRSLLASSKPSGSKQLQDHLVEKYGGTVTLTYKGREALELAVKHSGLPQGSAVGINGFTCYVVYLAVKNAGYEPVFIDIADGQTNFSISELQAAHKSKPNLKAIIVQNTLGYPIGMTAILNYCRSQNLMLIEDLAHSIGAVYDNNYEAGTVGQFTMLSFSQDKPIDAVAGGAVIDRRSNTTHIGVNLPEINPLQRFKNRTYPFWTSLIRGTYSIGFGRWLHFGLKKLNLLSTPMNDDLTGLHSISNAAAGLVAERFNNQSVMQAHRQQVGQIYENELPKTIQLAQTVGGQASYLRFPITVSNRSALVEFLRSHRIYIGDTWYDAPIGPKKYLAQTTYQTGQCPHAEKLAETIVNLPTHQYVTPEVAKDICAKIKLWVSLQQKS
jgi:dTDP-4-amino-4,6-dideoxygalactose transaminase